MAQTSGLHPEAPKILAVEPQLFVSDIAESCEFFEALGFDMTFVHGEPPFYAQVRRGECALNPCRVTEPPFDDTFREREPDALSATMIVGNAARLFQDYCLEGGIDFHQTCGPNPGAAGPSSSSTQTAT